MEDKKHNFLVVYVDNKGIELFCGVDTYIVNAVNEDEVHEILDEFEGDKEGYSRIIQPLSKVKRLSKKELSVRQVMEMISNPEHFAESVKLLETMILDGKINYNVLKLVLSPYFEIIEKQKLVENIKSNETMWKNALMGPQDKKAFRIVLRYLPKNKKPFKHSSQTYDLWIEKEGPFKDLKKKIIFKIYNNGSSQTGIYSMCQFFEEMRKIIPDLPARIEQRIIEIM